MPQNLQDRAQIKGLVNGEQTPVLPIGQTYHLLNTPVGTTGELALEVRGKHIPLIHDIEEVGGVARPEDLKVLIGAEMPDQALVSVPRDSRIDHAKRLLRTNGRIGAPLTKQARIEEIEAQQRDGIADADAEAELWNIIRAIEDETGEYFIMPVPRDMIVTQMENPLPPAAMISAPGPRQSSTRWAIRYWRRLTRASKRCWRWLSKERVWRCRTCRARSWKWSAR